MQNSSSLSMHYSAKAVVDRQMRRIAKVQYLKSIDNDCGSQINNFNSMQVSQIIQSPPIRKISKTSIQFRQLIQSLRRNHNHSTPVVKVEETDCIHKVELQKNQQASTVVMSESKGVEQTNNFITPTQSEGTLKIKPKMEVGDRDKLKKKMFQLDNPEEHNIINGKSRALPNSSLPIQSKQYINTGVSPMINVSTQYDGFSETREIPSFSSPSPRKESRTGHIVKQVVVKEEPVEYHQHKINRKIKDISESVVLEYLKKENKLHEKSDPSEIFNFFTNLCLSCDVIIKTPSIKKYKNCVYFGHTISKQSFYEGFLYFYDGKIYYGEFINGLKNGLGVELSPNENITMKGQFRDGQKSGKFYIEKPSEKYIGFLENGLYQGEGRLTTDDYIFEGVFEKGQKHGYGQEFYPKTGVKLSGMFKNGILEKARPSKSISELKPRNKIGATKQRSKQRSKQRLNIVRQKSLEKHNQRMNKIRNPSQRESEYEIQFESEDYQEPRKLHINANKLDPYRQPPQLLPKICQQFEYSFENGRNFESISSHHDYRRRPASRQKKQFALGQLSERNQLSKTPYLGGQNERMGTTQFEQPLPTPCLSVIKRRR